MNTTQTAMSRTGNGGGWLYEIYEVSTGKTMNRGDNYAKYAAAVPHLNAIRAAEGSSVRYALRTVWA